MKERWIEYGKKADFEAWAKELSVSPLFARILKNRGIDSVEEAKKFLYGTVKDLLDPALMKDMEKAASLLVTSVKAGKRIAIVNDYDCDGIFSGQIVYELIGRLGGTAVVFTPNRVKDGYGINRRIIDEAYRAGCSVILTTDNGISASEEIQYAKLLGFTVILTDHHEPRTVTENGVTTAVLPNADAVVDPKRADETFPYRDLCGAGVALYLARMVYRLTGIPEEETGTYYEYAAIATVADVVSLTGENRIIVRYGIELLKHTEKAPLKALMEASMLSLESVNATTIGFVLAPSVNSIGRLADPTIAFRFLTSTDENEARETAGRIRALNEERKALTEEGFRIAKALIEEEESDDKVLVVSLEDVNESIIGIIAGRIKEAYYKPVFLLTESGTPGLLKGSGRSIEGYHMANELQKVSTLLERFGGHAGAAGLSIRKENVDAFRKTLNREATLTEEDLTPVVKIDARAPISYMTKEFVRELKMLEPCGTGNDKPLFARQKMRLRRLRLLGEKQNFMKMTLEDETGRTDDAVMRGDFTEFFNLIRKHYGRDTVEALLEGNYVNVELAFTYRPEIHEYRGYEYVQLNCVNYCKIG